MPQPLLHYREQAPPADLAQWVEAFWFIRTLASAPGQARHWVLPEGNLNLVFWLPQGWKQSEMMIPPILSGPTLKAFRKPALPGETYLGVRFRAGAGPAFFGCKGTDLTSIIQPLANVQSYWANRLGDRLASAASESVALELLVKELRFFSATRPAMDSVMVKAATWLSHQTDRLSIQQWSNSFGMSERQFRRRFTEAIGLSPKSFSRIVRMQSMVRSHLLKPQIAWGLLSYQAGYSDQAHLVNDFRTLSGDRPTSYHQHVQFIDHASLLSNALGQVRNLQDAIPASK